MEIWSIVLKVVIIPCVCMCMAFFLCILFGCICSLVVLGVFLLQYPLGLMFWICEKTFPPDRKESIHQRKPEPSPPPSSMTILDKEGANLG